MRITRKEWVKQVFTIKKYYPGIARHWGEGSIIFFAKRFEGGDLLIGYGVVKRFVRKRILAIKRDMNAKRWVGGEQ